jgi:hypothetical protein
MLIPVFSGSFGIDDELVPVRGVIKAMLDKKEASGVSPDERG